MDPEPLGDGGSPSREGPGAVPGSSPTTPGLTVSQRRAELRRRKLLMNSEERFHRIMGFHRPKAGEDGRGEGGGRPRWAKGAGSLQKITPRLFLWAAAAAAEAAGWGVGGPAFSSSAPLLPAARLNCCLSRRRIQLLRCLIIKP